MHYKTHTMTSRYGSHDMENVSATQDSAPLDLAPPEHNMPDGDDEYCEETDTHHPLDELLEQFWQHKDQFVSLKSTIQQSTPTADLTQLTDKLLHLPMMLKLHSAPQAL